MLLIMVSSSSSIIAEDFQQSKGSFDHERLEELKSSKTYNYDREIEESESWLAKIFKPIAKFFSNFFGGLGILGSALAYIAITIIVLLLIAAIVFVASDGTMFRKAPKESALSMTNDIEDIKEMDLSVALNKALEAGDFRLATRYLYLIILKDLDAKKLIQWEIKKTNYDYVNELKAPKLRDGLRFVTMAFEYVWYGEIPMDSSRYDILKQDFDNFKSKVGS